MSDEIKKVDGVGVLGIDSIVGTSIPEHDSVFD